MKKYFWMILTLLVAGGLCACGAPGASADRAAESESAPVSAVAGAVELPGQALRFILAGDGDGLWLAGWGEGELKAWQSSDAGDTWQEQALDWPESASLTAVEDLLPDGRMLAAAVDDEGECLLAGGPGEPFALLDLPALNGYAGFTSACWVDGQTLSLTLTRYESFTNAQGQAQTTVAPLPVSNVVCAPGQQGSSWGDGPVMDRYSAPVSDGEKLYCADWTDNTLVTVTADGRWEKASALEGWSSGPLYAREGRVYYLTDSGVIQYPDTALAAPPEMPWQEAGAVVLDLCVTDHQAFVLWVDEATEIPRLYRWSIS